jgi:hypothetical protein
MKILYLGFVLMLCFSCNDKNHIEYNAKQHAIRLGLQDPLISCDPGTCYCTISWKLCKDNNCSRDFACFNCCKNGCSIRR